MSILPLFRECILKIGKNSVREISVGADEELRLRLQILTNSTKRDIMLTIKKQNAMARDNSTFNDQDKDVLLQTAQDAKTQGRAELQLNIFQPVVLMDGAYCKEKPTSCMRIFSMTIVVVTAIAMG